MNTCIRIGDQDYDIGVPVYRWFDEGGFNGYTRKQVIIETREDSVLKSGWRFSQRKREMEDVSQFVVHHSGGDGATPATMYDVLWNQRFLSVQFAIEDDGRVYQFLDPQVIAWHAGKANRNSVGVECCLMPDAGSRPNFYPATDDKALWTQRQLSRNNLPHTKLHRKIQGVWRDVFMMPDVQVDSLARLTAMIWIATGSEDAPTLLRNEDGTMPMEYSEKSMEHVGLLSHFQLSKNKWDCAGLDHGDYERKVADYFKNWPKLSKNT